MKQAYLSILLKRASILLLSILLCSPLSLCGQSHLQRMATFVRNIHQFSQLNPQEKVFLHFDNTGYFIGDTIWFKAYIVEASELRLTDVSKLLHVEMLTPEGDIYQELKLKIENGQCHGDIPIETKFTQSGFYEIRAYTRSMLNFGDDCIFSRVFPVYEKPTIAGDYREAKMEKRPAYRMMRKASSERLEKLNLAFYPEGGNSIIGLPSHVAFKATDQNGEETDIEGNVYAENGDWVAALKTVHEGMGVFEYTPQAGQYKAIVTYNNKEYRFSIPAALPSGYALCVTNTDEKILAAQINATGSLANDSIGVSLSCRGKVISFQAGIAPLTLRYYKEELPAGVLQLTVFNADGQILAERLAFNNKPAFAPIIIQQDKPHYAPFEKITLTVSAPPNSTFSLAVRDKASSPVTSYGDNLLTDLLLSSDIRGYVKNPMYYFEKNSGNQHFGRNDRNRRFELDLLMMVQGWRRYNWQQMAGVVPFEGKQYVEEGLVLAGKVVGLKHDSAKVIVSLSRRGRNHYISLNTDSTGYFHTLIPDEANLFDKWNMTIQARHKKRRYLYRAIRLDRVFAPVCRPYTAYDLKEKMAPFVYDTLSRSPIDAMQYLSEVSITKHTLYRKRPNKRYNVERDFNRWIDAGATHYPGSAKEYIEYKDPDYFVVGPQVNYAGNPVRFFHSDSIDRWLQYPYPAQDRFLGDFFRITIWANPPDVIKYLQGTPIPGSYLPDMVAISLRNYKDAAKRNRNKYVRYTYFNGYASAHEFYHPDYSGRKALAGIADNRRTLYWNPTIQTDAAESIVITCYNNSNMKDLLSIDAMGIQGNNRIIK
ncbi:MAG: hypothetical protein LBM06_07555 [Prevotellaceae bacterium]|jgi:hypothetical protein|nr:hypothetical protein [Prevotellaceae bacterium]